MEEALRIVPLRENLWALDEIGKTVMYVVNGTERVLLIDTGLGLSDLKKTVEQLCGKKEIVVVNSHGHIDHDSGNNQFDQVYMGRFDEPDGHAEVSGTDRKRLEENFFAEYVQRGGRIEGWNPGPAGKVIPLQEGDQLGIGNYTFRVLECPGHTLGSIVLFEEREGWMFTGDLILTWEVWGQLERSAALRVYGSSMTKLAALSDRVQAVFPAHWNTGFDPSYTLPPRVLGIYAEGIRRILEGKAECEDYPFPKMLGGNGPAMKCSRFEIGGIVFNPDRI